MGVLVNRIDFIERIAELQKIADDDRLCHDDRIVALCKLYSMYQHDVYNQEKCVTKINDIAECKTRGLNDTPHN
jgi:hypothetical protein